MQTDNKNEMFSEELLKALNEYIDAHYIPDHKAAEVPDESPNKTEQVIQSDGERKAGRKSGHTAAEDGITSESEILWKGSDQENKFLHAQKIQLENGIPVLSDSRPKIPESREDLKEAMQQTGETFQEKLFQLIDDRGFSDAEVYRRANLDRRLFSKIRHNADYHPRKKTVLALSAALCLNLAETKDLLGRAELAFSPASKADLIVAFCIQNRIYDLYKINALLEEYGQPLL